MEYYTAIVLAAGQGKRMNSKVKKQYMRMAGKPVLYYSLQAFQNSQVNEIILVTEADETEYCQEMIVEKHGLTKVKQIIAGGKERYHSVYEGLKRIEHTEGYCLIHDGARPLLTEDIIKRCMESVRIYHACIVGMPVKDTIKVVDDDEFAGHTLKRSELWMVQTPQAFYYPVIRNAYNQLMDADAKTDLPITDDAMVLEYYGNKRIKMIVGSYENIKITTPEDLKVAEAFLGRV